MNQESNDFLSLEEAQKIMGDNFLGPKEVLEFLEIDESEREKLLRVVGISCPKELLETNRDCILIPGCSFTLLDFHKKMPKNSLYPNERDVDDIWYIRESFASNNQVKSCWYLAKQVLVDSLNKTYNQGEALVKNRKEEVPFACELFYITALCYLTGRGCFIKRKFSFCRDVIDGCYHLHVGIFPLNHCFDVRHYMGLEKAESLGIAPICKIPYVFPDKAKPV